MSNQPKMPVHDCPHCQCWPNGWALITEEDGSERWVLRRAKRKEQTS